MFLCVSELPRRTETNECSRYIGRLLSDAAPMLSFTLVWVKDWQIQSSCENKSIPFSLLLIPLQASWVLAVV